MGHAILKIEALSGGAILFWILRKPLMEDRKVDDYLLGKWSSGCYFVWLEWRIVGANRGLFHLSTCALEGNGHDFLQNVE